MSRFEDLRLYITEEINYRKLGEGLVGYFDIIYAVYLSIMKGVENDFKEKKGNQTKLRELKKIVLEHLVDLNSPLKISQLQVALDRLEYKYESVNKNDDVLTEAISSMLKNLAVKVGKFHKAIGPIIAFSLTLTALIVALKSKRKERELITTTLKTDQMFSTTYNAYIYPGLERILNDITNRRIKKESQLKQSFYKIIDRLVEFNPMIAPYLKTWGVGI